MKVLMSLTLLAVLSAGCGQKKSSEKEVSKSSVIGGTHVEYNTNDAIANATALYVTTTSFACSGTLVSKRVVLTAAHCLETGKVLEVHFGEYGRGTTKVKNFVLHEKYDPENLLNDIAVIILEKDVSLPNRPVSIFESPNQLIQGTPLTVAGFSPHVIAQRQNIYDVFKMDIESEYKKDKRILRRQDVIYMGEQNNKVVFAQAWGGICPGDSGGPTYVMGGKTTTKNAEPFLFAINSSTPANRVDGTDFSDCEKDADSTIVAPYRAWIEKQIKKVDQPKWEDAAAKIHTGNIVCGQVVLWSIQKFVDLLNYEDCATPEEIESFFDALGKECNRNCADNYSEINRCQFILNGKRSIMRDFKERCSN